MSTSNNGTPPGWHSVTSRIVVRDSEGFVGFVRFVFEASGEYRSDRPTIVTIGDSVIMISEAGTRKVMTSFLYVYVPDLEATYQRALKTGARSLEAPFETGYGDRRCMVEDNWGNTWQIATFLGS